GWVVLCFFFQAEDGIRDRNVTGVQTCALPICGEGLGHHALAVEQAREETLHLAARAQGLDAHGEPVDRHGQQEVHGDPRDHEAGGLRLERTRQQRGGRPAVLVRGAPRAARVHGGDKRGAARAISRTRCGASPRDGSSISKSLGRAMSARPMASICCSPPLSVPACWRRRSFRRGKRAKTRSTSCSIARRSRRANAPIRRLSPTLMKGKTWRPSGTIEMPRPTIRSGRRLSIRWPSNQISPEATGASPVTARSVVVLPAPLAPMIAI